MGRVLSTKGPAAKALFALGVDDDGQTLRDFVSPARHVQRVGTVPTGVLPWGEIRAPYFSTSRGNYLSFPKADRFGYNNGRDALTFVVVGEIGQPFSNDAWYYFDQSGNYRWAKIRGQDFGDGKGIRIIMACGADRTHVSTRAYRGGELVTIAFVLRKYLESQPQQLYIGAAGSALELDSEREGGQSGYGEIWCVGEEPGPGGGAGWYGKKSLFAIFQGALTQPELQRIHADPYGAMFGAATVKAAVPVKSAPGKIVGHAMSFELASRKWREGAVAGPLASPINNGAGAFFYSDACSTIHAYRHPEQGLVLYQGQHDFNPAPTLRRITEPAYASIQPERYQQWNDQAGNWLYVYDWQGGRVVAIGSKDNTAIRTVALVPATKDYRIDVGIAFDSRRRRLAMFFPDGIKLIDLYTGNVTGGGTLPPGVPSFNRAIYDPCNDVIVAFGYDGGCDKMHRFQFADVDLSDQAYEPGQAWDGGSGVTAIYWNAWLRLLWKKPGGDWVDRAGATQGRAAYAEFPAFQVDTSIETKSTDVTELVEAWVSAGNTGALLTGATVYFASRFHPEVSYRPRLSVTTTSGTQECKLLHSGSAAGENGNPLAGAHHIWISWPNQSAFVQWDLSHVAGKVVRATMTLTKLRQADSAQRVAVHRVKAPRVRTEYTPSAGLADGYAYDRGIARHPAVLYADTFSDGWHTRAGARNAGDYEGEYVDSWLAGKAGKFRFSYGSSTALSTGVYFHAIGKPDPSEAYARYYVYLDLDFGSCVTANKMPGWDGRYGTFTARIPYPAGASGNGGDGCTGTVFVDGGKPRWHGWSLRQHWGAGGGEPTDLNPYRKLTRLYTYAYDATRGTSNFGDYWDYATPAVIKRGRWYCIEQYVKLNSVDASKPDEHGNGIGARDGAFKVWLDGELLFDKRDLILRNHPAYKIDGFWLNWQHGGLEGVQAYHRFRMANLVIASQYIGPMRRA